MIHCSFVAVPFPSLPFGAAMYNVKANSETIYMVFKNRKALYDHWFIILRSLYPSEYMVATWLLLGWPLPPSLPPVPFLTHRERIELKKNHC